MGGQKFLQLHTWPRVCKSNFSLYFRVERFNNSVWPQIVCVSEFHIYSFICRVNSYQQLCNRASMLYWEIYFLRRVKCTSAPTLPNTTNIHSTIRGFS